MKYYVQSIYKTTGGDTSDPKATSYTNYDTAYANFYTKHGSLVAEATTTQVSTILYDEMHNELESALWVKTEATATATSTSTEATE